MASHPKVPFKQEKNMRKSVITELALKLPPAKIASVINKIRDGVSKFQQKMVPPHVALLEMVTGMWIAQAVGVAAKLALADHVEPNGTSVNELAKATGTNSDALYRILRALASIGVFKEESCQVFHHTPISECLKSDHPNSMRHWAIFQTSLNWEHWGELEYTVKTGKNAVEKVRGEKPFEHMAKHPEKAEIFDKAMTNISRMEIDAVISAYDFSRFETIADIGGGYGTTLFAILGANTNVKGILFDLPHVLEGVKKQVDAAGLSDRIQIEKGSFFDSVPAGADSYLMKHIIHDWSDDEAIQIMKNVRSRISKSGKLLLVELVIADRNSKLLDLEMLVVTTGKERTTEEYAAIMAKAGFKLERIVPTVSMASVLEGSPL
jgi:O-methyltransferase domain